MRRIYTWVIFLFTITFIPGCVAPGSSAGMLKIEGSLVTSSNNPLAFQEIELIIPATYGLGDVDLLLNSPEDFGHKDQKIKAVTDSKGSFSLDLGKRVYHVDVWIFPPLGGKPNRPPALLIFARFPNNNSEYYVFNTYNGAYKIFDYSGSELLLSESQLENVSVTNKKGDHPNYGETIAVINLKTKPN